MWYLDEGAFGELLVDLRFVHDVLGPAGVLQGAHGLLDGVKGQPSAANTMKTSNNNNNLCYS